MKLPNKYPHDHYERKADRYSSALHWLFGVKVDDPTRNRWCDLISLGRSIDTYLDENVQATLLQRTIDITQLLEQPDNIATQFPALSIDQLGEATYGHLKTLGNAILDVNLDYKTTDSLRRYAFLRRAEGRLYAQLISSVATPKVQGQPGYSRFSRWLETTGEVTNLVNSFHGIRKEYANGEITLEPDNLTQIRLVGHMVLAVLGSTNPLSGATDHR